MVFDTGANVRACSAMVDNTYVNSAVCYANRRVRGPISSRGGTGMTG